MTYFISHTVDPHTEVRNQLHSTAKAMRELVPRQLDTARELCGDLLCMDPQLKLLQYKSSSGVTGCMQVRSRHKADVPALIRNQHGHQFVQMLQLTNLN